MLTPLLPPVAATVAPYVAAYPARSEFIALRGLDYHVLSWGDAASVTPERPALVLLHGWMDVAASFQFMVDALQALGTERYVIAPDWRGFGLTRATPGADGFWFPDYLADLDALLDALLPGQSVDLLGHSMGGNIAMIYAGVRPERIRRLVNLEGFGMPECRPAQAPQRYVRWLDDLKKPLSMRRYTSQAAVADRLCQNNPLLAPDKAAWLSAHWSEERDDGFWHILGDPAHKHINPVLYRKDEVMACWQRISAPVLWVEGDRTDVSKWWGNSYPRSDFEARLAVVPQLQRELLSPCGHMLHHDQPEVLARRLAEFLDLMSA
jgi:pimeloyl-ACP methyl ester carboxylesterase